MKVMKMNLLPATIAILSVIIGVLALVTSKIPNSLIIGMAAIDFLCTLFYANGLGKETITRGTRILYLTTQGRKKFIFRLSIFSVLTVFLVVLAVLGW